ncbi:MAG TPA: S41 family peptidase [Thermoanaerobaculia bacterium]
MHRSIFAVFAILWLALAPCVLAGDSSLSERERRKLFEEVWKLVRTEYYDQAIASSDWVAIGDRYRQRLATVQSDKEVHILLAEMLAQLHDTHTYYEPPVAGGPRPTLGLEIGEVDGRFVIAAVADGSEAAQQGVRPGMILRTMNGRDIRDVARELDAWIPTWMGISSERVLALFRLSFLLKGPAGQEVALGLSDPSGQPLEVRVHRTHTPKPVPLVASRRLAPDMGYIRWATWDPELDPALTETIRAQLASLRDTRSLVIDLRGNTGGDPQVLVDVLGCLATKEIPYGEFRGPRRFRKIQRHTCPFVYTGSVAVLMDWATGSTSEIFSNLMQETGRGTLVGAQSSGSVLYHQFDSVRGGGRVYYSRWGYTSPGGRRLQGSGVLPDVPVQRTIAGLWEGRDEVLEAAVELLNRQTLTGQATPSAPASPP